MQTLSFWKSLKFVIRERVKVNESRDCVVNGLKHQYFLTLSQTNLQYKSFEYTVEKGEIACNEQFLPFTQCFLPLWSNFPPFSSNLKLSSANSFTLKQPKICHLG